MTSNPYVILVRCITALYLANKTEGDWNSLYRVITDTLKDMDMPRTVGDDSDGTASYNLRDIADWMLAVGHDMEFTQEELMSRARLNLRDRVHYIEELERAIAVEGDEEKSKKRIRVIQSELRHELTDMKTRQLVARLNKQLNFSGDRVDPDVLIQTLDETTNLVRSKKETGREHGSFIGRMDTEDEDSIESIFTSAKDLTSVDAMMRTGLVGLNRMFGGFGIRRGEEICFFALSHHYKTGIMNDFSRWLPLYNKPHPLKDPTKKGMVLRVGFENKLEQDVPRIYRSLVEQETGEKISLRAIQPGIAKKYVKERLEATGFSFKMESYRPDNFDVEDLIDVLQKYINLGYEIHAVLVDYLDLIIKRQKERQDIAIYDAFEKLRNFCFPHGIAIITAHQFNSTSKEFAAEDPYGFAALALERGFFFNAKILDQKLDCSVGMHIVKANGRKYLTFARGKHRDASDETPLEHTEFAYPFELVGGICDDIEADKPGVIYDLQKYVREQVSYNGMDQPEYSGGQPAQAAEAW